MLAVAAGCLPLRDAAACWCVCPVRRRLLAPGWVAAPAAVLQLPTAGYFFWTCSRFFCSLGDLPQDASCACSSCDCDLITAGFEVQQQLGNDALMAGLRLLPQRCPSGRRRSSGLSAVCVPSTGHSRQFHSMSSARVSHLLTVGHCPAQKVSVCPSAAALARLSPVAVAYQGMHLRALMVFGGCCWQLCCLLGSTHCFHSTPRSSSCTQEAAC